MKDIVIYCGLLWNVVFVFFTAISMGDQLIGMHAWDSLRLEIFL